MITPTQLKTATGIQDINVLTSIVNSLNATFAKYEINSTLRICHFLAQVMHESGNFKSVVENLNYSAAGLMATFPSHFNQETAASVARNPEAIANIVYANRMGNTQVGDGWKFIGRGYIML